jgi:hypothetical protein
MGCWIRSAGSSTAPSAVTVHSYALRYGEYPREDRLTRTISVSCRMDLQPSVLQHFLRIGCVPHFVREETIQQRAKQPNQHCRCGWIRFLVPNHELLQLGTVRRGRRRIRLHRMHARGISMPPFKFQGCLRDSCFHVALLCPTWSQSKRYPTGLHPAEAERLRLALEM